MFRIFFVFVLFISQLAQAKTEFLPVDQAFAFSWQRSGDAIELRWDIADEYYLYDKRLKLTSAQGASDLTLRKVSTSVAQSDPYFGEVQVYRQQLVATIPAGKLAGNVTVGYQGCADAGLCYPPQKREVSWTAAGRDIKAKLNAALVSSKSQTQPSAEAVEGEQAAAQEAQQALTQETAQASIWSGDLSSLLQGHSLAMTLLIFFVLGLGLTFTPCVLPMLPILSSLVVGQKASRGRAFVLGVSYVQGMALVYAAAGLITASLGAAGNIQAAMQQPWVLILFAVFFAILAAAMFGLFELQLPAFIRDRVATGASRQGVVGIFITGAISALVVSPCVTAPLAGALLYISASGDMLSGGLALYAMALGMGVPLILVVVLGSHWLPKSGQWMNKVKAVFGILLLGVSLWLLGRLWDASTVLLVWGAFAVVVSIVAGALSSADSAWGNVRRSIAMLGFIYGVMLFVGGFSGGSDPLRPINFNVQAQLNTAPQAKKTVVNTVAQLQDLQRQALDKGQPLLVKVAADWCVSCKVMEKTVFAKPDVKALLAGVKIVQFDVTENSKKQQAWLQQYGIFGPPAVLVYDTQGQTNSQALLQGEVAAEQFLQHYKTVL